MGALKIKKGDSVVVISGKSKGQTGTVLRVDPKSSRVYVEGANIVKRHVRPNPAAGAQSPAATGGVVEQEGPIHISNVMLLDPETKKPTRVKLERSESGGRIRVAKRSGAKID